jgi:hypothetical protein
MTMTTRGRLLVAGATAALVSAVAFLTLSGSSPGTVPSGWVNALDCQNGEMGVSGDLGVQINCADAQLGSSPGGIEVPPGNYTISTTVKLSNNRVLHLGLGTYRSTTNMETILYRDNNTIYGDGYGTILLESDRSGSAPGVASYAVFSPLNNSYSATSDPAGIGATNVVIRDLQIAKASPTLGTGGQSTLYLGNSLHVRVQHVYMNQTSAIGIDLGGSSRLGVHARDIIIEDCSIEGTALQQVSIVNSEDSQLINNNFRAGFHDGLIDIEANTANDSLRNIIIRGNAFDMRTGTVSGGIAVQGALTNAGPVTIAENTFMGEDIYPTGKAFNYGVAVGGVLVNGFFDVLVTGNNFQGRFSGYDVMVTNSQRITVSNNVIGSAGVPTVGGTQAPIYLSGNVLHSRIMNNSMYAPANQGNPDDGIYEKPSVGNDYNFIGYNVMQQDSLIYDALHTPKVVVSGPHSVSIGNIVL